MTEGRKASGRCTAAGLRRCLLVLLAVLTTSACSGRDGAGSAVARKSGSSEPQLAVLGDGP